MKQMQTSLEKTHRGSPLSDILSALDNATRIAISAHTYPDGDAVGSCLAMAGLLRARGKDVTVLLPRKDVGPVRVLEGFEAVRDPDDFDFSCPPDLFLALDCSDPGRICDPRIAAWTETVPTLNIDHHGKALFGRWNYVVNDASSTGELVHDIAAAAGWPLDRPAAEALWCALVTDTNRFTLTAVTADTLRCAADLLAAGARAAWLSECIYMSEARNVFDLRTRAMKSLETWCGGLAAAISLDSDDFAQTGCTKQDAEEFPNIPRAIEGTKVSLYFYPFPVDHPTGARISARSREGSPVTARDIAEHFGGAGHLHSAGAVYPGSVHEAAAAVRSYLESVLQ